MDSGLVAVSVTAEKLSPQEERGDLFKAASGGILSVLVEGLESVDFLQN